LRSPSSVKLGVPSSINERSVRYMPRYGMHGGSQRCKASRKFRKRPSDETIFCSFSIVCLVWEERNRKSIYIYLCVLRVCVCVAHVCMRCVCAHACMVCVHTRCSHVCGVCARTWCVVCMHMRVHDVVWCEVWFGVVWCGMWCVGVWCGVWCGEVCGVMWCVCHILNVSFTIYWLWRQSQ
jgi:hypothetical protein